MSKAIRPLYDTLGAEEYYRQHANEYANPHEDEVRTLVVHNAERFGKLPILDFSCGGGEVTLALKSAGFENISGSDPFTHKLYTGKTGCPVYTWSFDDVIAGKTLDYHFGAIISSFALHLCPQKALFPLCWNLLQMAPLLVIITPHKRPEIEKMPGFNLLWEDAVVTSRGKKVRMKAYGL